AIVINDQKILPPAVTLGLAQYPTDIPATFKKYFKNRIHVVKGQEIALGLGNAQAANVVLVGAFSKLIPEIEDQMWLNALTDLLPKKIQDLNVKAFQKG